MNNGKAIVKKQTVIPVWDGLGKLPPQACDLEEAVLGAIMLEKDAYLKVSMLLSAADFYKDSHAMIFSACKLLFDTNCPIDILTVQQALKVSAELGKVGGPHYISQLTNRVASAANIEFHAAIIKQKSIQRGIIKLGSDMIREGFEDTTNVFELLEKIDRDLMNVGIKNVSRGADDAASRMDKTLKSIAKGMESKDGVTGVPLGYTSFDRFTGGAQRGDLIVVAARPGNYKTALIITFAHKAADLGFTAAIFQQEMGVVQSGIRELAMHSDIDSERMRNGRLSEAEFAKLLEVGAKLSKKNVLIDHEGGLSISKLRAKIRKMKPFPDIVYVDYLQLMDMDTGNKNDTTEHQIATTTKGMKLLAKELDVPIILLSQLSRDVEKTSSKKPMMSHLKGSGAIEADADTIMFLFNAQNYFPNPTDEQGNSLLGVLEVIFAKNRMGQTGSLFLKVNPATNTFTDDYEESVAVSKEEKQMQRNLNYGDDDSPPPF